MTDDPTLAPAVCDEPELFDLAHLQIRQDLVDMVRARSFVHTGKTITKDEALCRDVCRDLIRGLSRRQVAKKYGISRNSIAAIAETMASRGEMEPLKEETRRLLGRGIILALEEWTEAVAAGVIPPTQLPIPIGVLIDKKALLDGDATVRLETRGAAALTPDQVRELFERMKRAEALTIDTGSEGDGPQTLELQGPATVGGQFGGHGTPETALPTTGPAQVGPDARPRILAPPAGPGGGGRAAAGTSTTDGKPPENLSP